MKKFFLAFVSFAATFAASVPTSAANPTETAAADTTKVDNTLKGDDSMVISVPICKKGESTDYDLSTHVGVGWCNALGAPDDMDIAMGSSWEIFWTIAQWDYNKEGSRSTFSTGIGVDWRNYRMTGSSRFAKTDDDQVIITNYEGENVRPKFSRVKVFSLQVPVLYRYKISKGFSLSAGPVLNLNLHSSLKTRYKMDGRKYKEIEKDARVNPMSVDFMGIIETPAVNVYVKYSPCNVLKSAYAPKFQSLSVGFYL